RNKNGDYLGVLEVTQDVTEIQKLEGEKRLL
ncbi:MAG: PAS domain-containing protein, partial [Candidatus Heimdallarchaeaceae archaeon]